MKAGAIIALVGGLLLVAPSALPIPAPTKPAPAVSIDVWSDFADYVENVTKEDYANLPDTDMLINIAENLHRAGYLDNTSRVESFRPKNEEITEDNIDSIVQTLRGG